MKERKDIIERIRKLLALGKNNDSVKEMTSAVLMAQRLIVKYGIADDELNAYDDTPVEIIGVDAEPLVSARLWWWNLAHLIARNFRCKVWESKDVLRSSRTGRAMLAKRFTFYGYEQDARAASLAFNFLYRTGNRLANAAVRELRRKGRPVNGAYNSYLTGFLGGLRTELERQSMELMVAMPLAVTKRYESEVEKSIKSSRGRELSCDHRWRGLIERGMRDGRDAVRDRKLEAKR